MSIRLKHAISRLSDNARINGRSAPIITTDPDTAALLVVLIAEDIGCPARDLWIKSRGSMVMGTVDGVEIRHSAMEPLSMAEWRAHFGPLVEMMS